MTENEPIPRHIEIGKSQLASLLQLHTWFAVGLAEVQRLLVDEKPTEAMLLARLLIEHPCAMRDGLLVEQVVDHIWGSIFGYPADVHRGRIRKDLLEEATRLAAECESEATSSARAPRDLPS